jgi:CRP/FNR family cyclic AMP-dependent transcriptional regulator
MAATIGFVDSLPDDDRRVVIQACTRRKFRSGDTLFHEGDPGDTLHLLVKGHVAIRVTTPLGETVTLAVMGPNDSFGEQALVGESSVRTASAVALDAVETLALHRRDFDALRATNARVDRFLVAVLAAQVRRLSGQVVDALHATAESRVARRLHDLAGIYSSGETPIDVPITQEDLASMSGATRPTVNRALHELAAGGVVALSRCRIQIVDPARLAKLAGRG